MSRNVSFSVGIPTFNQAKFLPLTLDSLLHQERAPDEIVISDHQSTDGTAEIIAHYVAMHPKLIRGTQPLAGCGLMGQWRHTLSQLSGDWLTLLSSDDLARPAFCKVLIEGAQRRADAVLVRAGWENIDANGAVLSQQYMLSLRAVTVPPDTLLEQRNGPKASFAAFAIKRAALEQSGGCPEGMESLGDWRMFAQLAPFGSFIYEAKLISGYRVGHDGNKFRSRIGMWLRDERRMFMEVLPQAATRMKMQDTRWIADASRANFLRYLAAASEEFRPDERDTLLADFRPWAVDVGETAKLERFAAGESVKQTVSAKDVARRLLRPLAQRIANVRALRPH
jgi:cellulose synthase/poly-beta-1,6-N-acetylglucosamine synthase-like glycosyltransferase